MGLQSDSTLGEEGHFKSLKNINYVKELNFSLPELQLNISEVDVKAIHNKVISLS